MKTYVTIKYRDTDGKIRYVGFIARDNTKEEAREHAIQTFFMPSERKMIESVQATCLKEEEE